MEGFHLSEKEVLADFDFVVGKIRSYRFERLMPIIDLRSIEFARANRLDALYTLTRLNLEKDPAIPKVITVPYDPTGSGTSEAERIMMEIAARRADRGRK